MYFVNHFFVILLFVGLDHFQCEAQEQNEWPDLSCRDGYAGSKLQLAMSDRYEGCIENATPGPNDEVDWDNLCIKLCMTVNSHLAPYDQILDKFAITTRPWGDVWSFDEATHKKVHEQCADLFETVFYVEKDKCNSVRANEVYDCVQKALC